MSRYTTEVRYICESLAGLDKSVGYSNVNEVIEKSRNKIFPPLKYLTRVIGLFSKQRFLNTFTLEKLGAKRLGYGS